MNIHDVECDISELHKGIFRAKFKAPGDSELRPLSPHNLVRLVEPRSIPVVFSPAGLYRLKNVEITGDWDIEYVQVANIIIPAFRKSPPPLCTPNMQITILVSPHRFVNGHRVDTTQDGTLTVSGELLNG